MTDLIDLMTAARLRREHPHRWRTLGPAAALESHASIEQLVADDVRDGALEPSGHDAHGRPLYRRSGGDAA